MSKPSPLESIFFAALEKRGAADRLVFLEQACSGSHELRATVERMLAVEAELGTFLEAPAAVSIASIRNESEITEKPGTVIDPYKILQQIGEGGMGVVFMA